MAQTKQNKQELDALTKALASPVVQRFAAESLEPLGSEGPLRGESNGQVVIELADKVIRLRVPSYGEFQRMNELSLEAADGSAALGWWREVSAMLGDGELPDAEELPLWLANPVYARQAVNHWMLRPTRAPGT